MRLIDADALKEHKFVDTDDNYRIGWNDALDAATNCEPTVDAVPVIRCKDCKWYEFDKPMECGLHGLRSSNDYCSDAEMDEK